MKNALVLLWKIEKKSKNLYKTCVFLKISVVKPISGNGFGPRVAHTRLERLWGTLTDKLFRECWKSIGFTVFSLKNVEKPLVLLCFRSKMLKKALVLLCFRSEMLKKHWFYCVFAPKCWKSIGFTMFSLQNVEKALVLLCFRSKMLKKHWFYLVFVVKM